MTITLGTIKAKQNEIASMIAAFEAQGTTKFTFSLPGNFTVALHPGELILGIVVSADSSRREAIVLLPEEADEADWDTQMKWAESIGGRLPDRVEGAMLFAHLKDEFKEEAYWTREQHASSSDYAWYQDFNNGTQHSLHKSARLRARAVRSIPIE